MKASTLLWVALGAVALLFGWYMLDKRKATVPVAGSMPAAGAAKGTTDHTAAVITAGAGALSTIAGLFGGKSSGAVYDGNGF